MNVYTEFNSKEHICLMKIVQKTTKTNEEMKNKIKCIFAAFFTSRDKSWAIKFSIGPKVAHVNKFWTKGFSKFQIQHLCRYQNRNI